MSGPSSGNRRKGNCRPERKRSPANHCGWIPTNLGVSGELADPTLELHDASGNLILGNDNWKDAQQQDITETGLAPSDERESAILVAQPPAITPPSSEARTTPVALL